ILGDKNPPKRKTIVVGGGATGCEVAHYLSDNGCEVTIIEMLPKVAVQLEAMTRKVLISKLKENGVKIMTGQKLSRIEENGAHISDADGNGSFLEAEAVVISIGNRPDNQLYEQLKTSGVDVYQIGDCLEPRSAKAAIYESAVIGRTI
ncbi:MAG: FAD-dependent oxidoreductase, partial [Deltaproteobacteria bacterium]|nr:FAD-dependent oxidoreductase [Deltaproteobacteria bacterium]